MKKILLIISLVALFSMESSAQSKSFRFGIKAGPTFDWASAGSTAVNNKGFRLGIGAGIVNDFFLTENIAFSSGVNVHLMNMRYQFVDYFRVGSFLEEIQIPVVRRAKVMNLEIPAKIKMRIDIVDSWKAFVEAGVGMGINLKDKGKDEYVYYDVEYKDKVYVDHTDQYRPLQASILFGVGAEFEVNRKWSLFGEVIMDHSLSNAFNRELEKQTGSILKTNFIGVEAGLLF